MIAFILFMPSAQSSPNLSSNLTGDTSLHSNYKIRDAWEGNVDAQYEVGMAYLRGKGVDQDYILALNFLNDAAEQGHASAQYEMGLAYDQVADQNYALALNWLNEVAEQDRVSDQYAIGLTDGQKVLREDYRQNSMGHYGSMLSIEGYSQASTWPVPLLSVFLAVMGSRLPITLTMKSQLSMLMKKGSKAYSYLKGTVMITATMGMIAAIMGAISATMDTIVATIGVKKLLQEDNKDKEISGDVISRDEEESFEKAFKFFYKSAKQGHAGAQYKLGLAHSQGRGTVQDKDEAIKWLSDAAEQGHPEAITILSLLATE